MSFEVDHVIPLDRDGSDELDNKAASHRLCNRKKSNRLAEELAAEAERAGPRCFVTARTW
jgi:5-methylcytosine-specific restriction endonuclease McrA